LPYLELCCKGQEKVVNTSNRAYRSWNGNYTEINEDLKVSEGEQLARVLVGEICRRGMDQLQTTVEELY